MRSLITFLVTCFVATPCLAWSEGGHHVITVMAYELLTKDEQQLLQTLLKAHPRFGEDFNPPKSVDGQKEVDLWRIGAAGYWPDIARTQPAFHRPSWHWQMDATLTLGDTAQVPQNRLPMPTDATLETKELNIAQAIELCRKVYKDQSQPCSQRALAICWLANLAGDSHQPCHAGSLYIAGLFPEGDRGANAIPVKQAKNVHSLWDTTLGSRFNSREIQRRVMEIKLDGSTWADAAKAARKDDGLNPTVWLAESKNYGRTHVYTREIVMAVEAAAQAGQSVESIDLSEGYVKGAGRVARLRAAFAAQRLAKLFKEGI